MVVGIFSGGSTTYNPKINADENSTKSNKGVHKLKESSFLFLLRMKNVFRLL